MRWRRWPSRCGLRRASNRYRGASVRRSLPGALLTASVPHSMTSTMGHGLGLRSAKAMKSAANARGSTTRLAWTHPGARWAVGPVCSPVRIASRASRAGPALVAPPFSPRPSSRTLARASRRGAWPLCSFARASSIIHQAALSTSGNSWTLPERGGHSSSKVLLVTWVASKSASNAHALIFLRLGSPNSPRKTLDPAGGGDPNSSSNSRSATVSASSPSANSPLGIDQECSSFLAQNGPPGCTSSTSISPAAFRRWSMRPALLLLAMRATIL